MVNGFAPVRRSVFKRTNLAMEHVIWIIGIVTKQTSVYNGMIPVMENAEMILNGIVPVKTSVSMQGTLVMTNVDMTGGIVPLILIPESFVYHLMTCAMVTPYAVTRQISISVLMRLWLDKKTATLKLSRTRILLDTHL